MQLKVNQHVFRSLLFFIPLILLTGFLIVKTLKLWIFLGLCLVSGTIVFINYYTKLPFDISPVFFLSILFTSTYGFGYTVVFAFVAGFIPSIISGKGLDFDAFMYLGLNLLMNFLSLQLQALNILTRGVVLSIVYSLLAAFMSVFMGSSTSKEMLSMVLTIIVNLFYFLKLTNPLLMILG